jgi:hypothetical protein
MPTLNVNNLTQSNSGLSDPPTLFFESILPGANAFDVTHETLTNLEPQLDELAARVDSNSAPTFIIDVAATAGDAGAEYRGDATLAHYLANMLTSGAVVADPTTPSVVAARRVNVAVGEAMIGGNYFVIPVSADETGTAEISLAGADVSAVDLAVDEDVYMAVVFVDNAGLETVFVRGAGVDNTGSLNAVNVTDAQIAAALEVYMVASAPVYEFVRAADVLYVESTGLTETVTALRKVPNYS